MVACTSQTPSDVALESIKLVEAGKYQELLDISNATPEQKESLLAMFNEKGDIIEEEKAKRGEYTDYKVVSENISDDGTTCEVVVECTTSKGTVETEEVSLVSVDDKWLVDIGLTK